MVRLKLGPTLLEPGSPHRQLPVDIASCDGVRDWACRGSFLRRSKRLFVAIVDWKKTAGAARHTIPMAEAAKSKTLAAFDELPEEVRGKIPDDRQKEIMKVRGFLLAAALVGCTVSTAVAGNESTLYRNSVTRNGMRIHIATFDADGDSKYNAENCSIAAKLFASQPGVAVRYWCELGRYRATAQMEPQRPGFGSEAVASVLGCPAGNIRQQASCAMTVSLAYAMKGQNESEKEAFRWFSAFNAELVQRLDKHQISEAEASEQLDMGVTQLIAIAEK